MKKVLLVDSAKCTGCEACVDACSGFNATAYTEKMSKIKIFKDEIEAVFIPYICEQCREHPCVSACPLGAIKYNEEQSIFNVDGAICTGCGACEEACLYDGIFVSGGLAKKCDLCGGQPACIAFCYPGALQYVEASEKVISADLENKLYKLRKRTGNHYGQQA